MSDMFCEPGGEQQFYTTELIGKRIAIFWDGDDTYFSAMVISFNLTENKHYVRYDNDDTSDLYPEALDDQPWKIWGGNEDEFLKYNEKKMEEV
jgi:hypothetical protein